MFWASKKSNTMENTKGLIIIAIFTNNEQGKFLIQTAFQGGSNNILTNLMNLCLR